MTAAAIAAAVAAAVGLAAARAAAGPADVIAAKVECADTCTITATVRHADAGWEHYANRFEVVAPDGAVLARRVLNHPHVHQQPFTRALSGVRIPDGIERVVVRANDSVHGLGGAEVEVRVERRR